MRLPRFLRDLVGAVTLHGYDTAKAELRSDLPEIRDVAASLASRMVDEARDNLRRDFDRVALFTILFRSQADQSRRMDSVDATLGVVLTALLVIAPIAFDKAPTPTDKWIALVGFALLVLIVGRALFFIGAPEPNATILAGKLLGDLDDPNHGSLEEVRASIRRLAADRRYQPTRDELIRRGAAGDLAQAIAEDRHQLGVKRFHLGGALLLFVVLAGTIGIRDMLYSPRDDDSKGKAYDRVHQEAVGAADPAGGPGRDPGLQRYDLRQGHAAAGLDLVVCGERRPAAGPSAPPGTLPLNLSPTTIPQTLLCDRWKP